MLLRPGFAIRALVFSDYYNRDVCLARCSHRGLNAFGIGLGIGLFNFVFIPCRPSLFASRDLAAFGIQHFDAGWNALANAVENADLISRSRITAVTTQVNVRRIGPD